MKHINDKPNRYKIPKYIKSLKALAGFYYPRKEMSFLWFGDDYIRICSKRSGFAYPKAQIHIGDRSGMGISYPRIIGDVIPVVLKDLLHIKKNRSGILFINGFVGDLYDISKIKREYENEVKMRK